MNANCEKKLVEEVLKGVKSGIKIEITNDEKFIYITRTNTNHGTWINIPINREDGSTEFISTNFACF